MKEYLNPNLRKYYERDRDMCRQLLNEIPRAEFHTIRNMDKKPIADRLKVCEQVLKDQSPPRNISSAQKNKAYVEYKQIQNELKETMMSKRDMHPTTTFDGRRVADMDKARANAEKLVKFWDKEKEQVRRLKNLGTLIDPDNPKIRDTESLRRR